MLLYSAAIDRLFNRTKFNTQPKNRGGFRGFNISSLFTDESEGDQEPPEDLISTKKKPKNHRIVRRETVKCGCGTSNVVSTMKAAMNAKGDWKYTVLKESRTERRTSSTIVVEVCRLVGR